MNTSTQGFTFIELMLVMGLIGILLALAAPRYLEYLQRSKVAEALILSIRVKKAISDYYAYYGKFPADNKQAGLLEPSSLRGRYVAEITVEKGMVRVSFFNSVHINGELIFVPVTMPYFPEQLFWDCEPSTLRHAYLPSC